MSFDFPIPVATTGQVRIAGAASSRWEAASASLSGVVPVCPLCGSRETDAAFIDNVCALRVCLQCDLFFVCPYPASSSQHAHVNAGANPEIEILNCARRYQGERLYYDRHFALIEEECAGARSLLDVGCGTGHLLERFAAKPDLSRMGIELNPQAAAFARRVSGCEILEIPIEQYRGARPFDVITLINVLSHIPSFDGLFRSLRAAVAPGGKVILRSSEMSRRVSRWNQVHWGIPDDLHFLGLRTLDTLCEKYGCTSRRHIRVAYEDELCRPVRWRQVGR
ncbi:MAG: class I SAM-dependent methyltransferase, partial [Candidatus Acidiferrales bacterium]